MVSDQLANLIPWLVGIYFFIFGVVGLVRRKITFHKRSGGVLLTGKKAILYSWILIVTGLVLLVALTYHSINCGSFVIC
jgi:hypothetical protein